MKNTQLLTFIENICGNDKELFETIKIGYDLLLNKKWKNQSTPPSEITTDAFNHMQNKDNEYFDKTLPDHILDKSNNAYIGSRLLSNKVNARTSVSHDRNPQSSGAGNAYPSDHAV